MALINQVGYILAIVFGCLVSLHAQEMYRLAGGTSDCEGRLQVFIFNSNEEVWYHTCSPDFTESEAAVLCRGLGCSGGTRMNANDYGQWELNTNQVSPFTYQCSGDEAAVTVCATHPVDCHYFFERNADIIAVNCTQVPVSPSSVPADNAAQPSFTPHSILLAVAICTTAFSLASEI